MKRVLAILLFVTLAIPGEARASEARDWRTWPFSRESPWNMPIGRDAQYQPIPGLDALPGGMNYDDRWTSSVVISTKADPLVHVYVNTNPVLSNWGLLSAGVRNCGNLQLVDARIRSSVDGGHQHFAANPWSSRSPNEKDWQLPSSFHPASQDFRDQVRLKAGACPSPDTDGLMADFQPDGWVLDTYATIILSNGDIVSGNAASFVDARGDGTGWWNGRRASMLPSFAGLIRNGEIANGRIPHAMALVMASRMLARKAVWPALAYDRNSKAYRGTLPMGALLAIPPGVDLGTLGLTKAGLTVAKAAQDYGVYVVDSTNGDGVTLQAELGDPDLHWDGWQRDLATIVHHLQLITNNSAQTPGGPGQRRADLAPDFGG